MSLLLFHSQIQISQPFSASASLELYKYMAMLLESLRRKLLKRVEVLQISNMVVLATRCSWMEKTLQPTCERQKQICQSVLVLSICTLIILPLLQLLVDKRVSTADNAPDHVPAPVHNKEDGRGSPPPRTQKPAHSVGDEFLSRFTRNANLVASGVAKNMVKVGHYVKNSVDDILFPYRRRPK
ncbi:hypothetical protein L1049_024388 [Liquidambar formosana]|uniref:Uncharacterized protein n=1 Tax=Liquidambar formosana TaxID=63359 RepID=A0AAP0S1V3_LIQFO